MDRKQRLNEYHTRERNHAIYLTDIILLNTNFDDDLIPQGSKILDAEMSVDYYVGWTPSESELYFFDNNDVQTSPYPNIAP